MSLKCPYSQTSYQSSHQQTRRLGTVVVNMFFPTSVYAFLALFISTASAIPGRGHARRQDSTVPPGTITDCTFWYDAVVGDTCASIASNWGITLQQFITYNPSVKSDCSGLVVGYSYCVEENNGKGPILSTTSTSTTSKTTTTSAAPTGPSPTQAGIISTCKYPSCALVLLYLLRRKARAITKSFPVIPVLPLLTSTIPSP